MLLDHLQLLNALYRTFHSASVIFYKLILDKKWSIGSLTWLISIPEALLRKCKKQIFEWEITYMCFIRYLKSNKIHVI